jgi:hemolysin III
MTQQPPPPPPTSSPAAHAPARVRIFKDPASAWSHFIAFIGALIGVGVLLSMTLDDTPKLIGMAVYGGSLVTLFLASSCYHFFDLGERGNRWLRRFDHAAIFLLIGGTYVPPLLHYLDGSFRVFMLCLVGGLALGGVLFKLLWIDCPDWLGSLIYLGMSFAVIIPSHQILTQLDPTPLALLITGGAAYVTGVGVFVFKWPDPWPDRFGHHDVWHIFVIIGAASHYAFTLHIIA